VPELLSQVEDAIGRHRLLRPGQSALVAVSGGLDSLVLLHVLRELSRRHRWQLTVAHLNHRLRGVSSLADERLVQRTAAEWRLPCIIERAAVRDLARARGESIEMAARQARHEFLARTARRLRVRAVALAHHADDQVELFFLRLLRGAGVEGLAGMEWRNPSPVSAPVHLVRPLLDQTRSSLRAYAQAHKIHYREDASNACLEFQRNRLRHELLPLLRRHYQAGLDRSILRTMAILAAESDFVSEHAQNWLNYRSDRHKLANRPIRSDWARTADLGAVGIEGEGVGRQPAFGELPVALQRRILQTQLRDRQIVAGFELVEFLRQNPGKRVSLGYPATGKSSEAGGVIDTLPINNKAFAVCRQDGIVEIQYLQDIKSFPGENREIRLGQRRRSVSYSGLEVEWQVVDGKCIKKKSANLSREFFDADCIGGSVLLRHWQAGDRFWPIGMAGSVKLQDFFTNLKVPRHLRHELVVAVAEGGEIFWVEGMRIAERFKLTQSTKRCLQWVWRRL